MVRTVLLGCLGWGTVHAQTIRPDDLTVLMAADAVHRGSVKTTDMGPGKVGWVESWDPSGSLSWTGMTTVPGSYTLSAILQGSGSGCLVEVAINSSRLTPSCLSTNWERVKLGTVGLSAPIQNFTLRSVGTSPVAKVFSLEIVKPEVQVKLAAQATRVAAPTDWMLQARYGVMVHWTSQSKPEQGSPLAYCQAVRNFDAQQFADVLDEMGAGYVVFTTSHAEFYFPGPNKVIDEILPGRTCSRDLVGDLAQALSKHGIKTRNVLPPRTG
jgi:Alpha-L-fucosidase